MKTRDRPRAWAPTADARIGLASTVSKQQLTPWVASAALCRTKPMPATSAAIRLHTSDLGRGTEHTFEALRRPRGGDSHQTCTYAPLAITPGGIAQALTHGGRITRQPAIAHLEKCWAQNSESHTWLLMAAFPVTRLGPPGSAVLRPLMRHPTVPLTWRFPIAGMPEVSTAGPAPIAGNPKIAGIRCHTHDFCPWCRRRQGAFRVVGVGGRSCHVRWPRGNDTAGQVDCQRSSGNQRADARFVHHRCSLKALRRAQCNQTLHRSMTVAYELTPSQALPIGSE